MARLTYITIAIATLLCPLLFAQSAARSEFTFPGEHILVRTNTTTLITGESLFCKFYCTDSSRKEMGVSTILYVELIDSNLKQIFKHKLYLENGIANGDFFMPTALPSGNYKLISYTTWMLDHSLMHFTSIDITLVNPFQPFIGKVDTLQLQKPVRNVDRDSKFILQPSKASYSSREKVGIKVIPSPNLKGNYSLSVRKAGFNIHSNEAEKSEAPTIQRAKSELPEMRGEMISGTILSKNGLPKSNSAVALSMPGKVYLFKIVETDALGKFHFILDRNPSNSTAIIQVIGDNRADFTIAIDDVKHPDLSQLQFNDTITINQNFQNEIRERSVAIQIENAYYDIKKDSIVEDAIAMPFFYPLAKKYVLDDYTRFPTLKETIIEVLKEIYVKEKKDKFEFHLRNFTQDAEIYGLPLVLVDGLLVQDLSELLAFEAKYIEEVSVINQPYIYGPKSFSGVIAISTKNQEFKSRFTGDFIQQIKLDRPLPSKVYKGPDYAKGNGLARIPDYRNQLVWIPQIRIDENQENIYFFTSDVKGEFEILLQGFAQDGTAISLTDYIEVK